MGTREKEYEQKFYHAYEASLLADKAAVTVATRTMLKKLADAGFQTADDKHFTYINDESNLIRVKFDNDLQWMLFDCQNDEAWLFWPETNIDDILAFAHKQFGSPADFG